MTIKSLLKSVREHPNLTFSVLGVLILVVLLGSLITEINFAVTKVRQAFETEVVVPPPVTRFDLAGFKALKLPVVP